jgi:plasmid stabilization system protein ParE
MSFRVRWKKVARDQLATVWLAHADQAGVTAAAHRIEQSLRHDPENVGEDRPNGRRVIFDAPPVVPYRVNTAANVVRIVAVGSYGTA